MKILHKIKFSSLMVLALLICLSIACGKTSDSTISSTTTSSATGVASRVEVDYFYESDACFCLNLAGQWIDTTIHTDYKNSLDSGKLVYKSYDTKDSANKAKMDEFKATNYAFFITVVNGTQRNTHAVNGLWLYTDTSGVNEVLKSKFIGLLKKELDKALAGG